MSKERSRVPRKRQKPTLPSELVGGNRRFMVIRRDDGRIGFYDTIGVWHTGLPVPDWGDFLQEIGLDRRLVPAALIVLGVEADWSCARRYRQQYRGIQENLVPHEPIVYYAACPGGITKIGTTKHLHSRWTVYQSDHKHRPDPLRPAPDRLLAVEAGDYAVEAAAIRHFQDLRIQSRSEYLKRSPELDAWISERAAWLHPDPGR